MSKQHTPTQHQRWLKYGINVAVLIIATLVIILLINWMGYRHFYRFDFTRTRQYSLSPQTTNLLDRLDSGIEVTTFYAAGSAEGELLRRVDDLLSEYTRRSGRIEVQHIDPAANPELRDQFIGDLKSRFDDELTEPAEALQNITQTYDQVRQFARQQTQMLPELVAKLSDTDQQTSMLLTQLNQIFLRLGKDLEDVEDQIQTRLDEILADYQGAAAAARQPLTQLNSGVLDVAIQRFQQTVDNPQTSNAVQDALLGLIDQYKKLRETVELASQDLDALSTPNYTRVRNSLLQSNCVVVTVPPDQTEGDGVVVLTLDTIYPNLQRAQLSRGEVTAEQGYRGEETVTGAILQLTLKHDTRVVFINPRPQSVLRGNNPQVTYTQVAERLRQMNFEVTEWQPGGSMGPMGQPAPPQPPPEAREGETLVYVVLPVPPPNPQRPTQRVGPQIAQAVGQHLQAGRPALVFIPPNQLASMGMSDPIAQLLNQFGVTVDNGRMIMTQMPGREGRMQNATQITLDTWPGDHPITQASRGLRGVLVQALPIKLPSQPAEGVTHTPLITTPDDTWADSEFMRPGQATRGEDDPAGPFTVASATTRGDQRLITIADRAFAVDMITQAGPTDIFGNTLYTTFPGNSEMFVNSMYWLAGLDQLIAPGARTQDVRRIEAVSRPALIALWWTTLAGLPAMCLVAGGIVWVVRRR